MSITRNLKRVLWPLQLAEFSAVPIRDIFDSTDSTLSKLRLDSPDPDSSVLATSSAILLESISHRPSHAPSPWRSKVEWALGGKARFIAQVEIFRVLVEKVYALVPPENSKGGADASLTQRLDNLGGSLRGNALVPLGNIFT
jgi:hypothetical protein